MTYPFIVISLLLSYALQAQNVPQAGSAAAMGLGNPLSLEQGPMSLFSGTAGIATTEKITALLNYQYRYGLAALSTAQAGVVAPIKELRLGLNLSHFGDSYFSENQITLAAAHKLGITTLGLKVHYVQWHIDEVGNRAVLVIDFGGHVELGENFYFSAQINNLNQATFTKETNEKVPTFLICGFVYSFEDYLDSYVEISKELDFPMQVKIGLSYAFLPKFKGRIGMSTEPMSFHTGLGVQLRTLGFDYAIQMGSVLGNVQALTVSYQFKK